MNIRKKDERIDYLKTLCKVNIFKNSTIHYSFRCVCVCGGEWVCVCVCVCVWLF
jgi:hypothetical protein